MNIKELKQFIRHIPGEVLLMVKHEDGTYRELDIVPKTAIKYKNGQVLPEVGDQELDNGARRIVILEML